MKKMFWYFLGSLAVSMGFVIVNMYSSRLMLQQGSGTTGVANIVGDSALGKYAEYVGICSVDKPLMLTDGRCVSCDYGANKNVDILLGCEQCPNLRGKNCAMETSTDVKVPNAPQKVEEQKPKKTSSNYKYKLIKFVGNEDKIKIVIQENATGQKSFVYIGDEIDNGWVVKSVSVNQGIIVEKDGVEKVLDIEM